MNRYFLYFLYIICFCILIGVNYSCSTPKKIVSQKKYDSKKDICNTCVKILKEAKSHSGTPYCDKKNISKCFDCSGFVNYVFKKHNRDVPRTTELLCRIPEIKKENAQKCDLILFKGKDKNKRGCGHVAIITNIIGNTLYFIHATVSKGVMENSSEDQYWKTRMIKIIRVCPE